MTPDEIAAIQILAENIAAPINEYLIADICRRVKNAGAITATAEYQIYRAEALGMSRETVAKAVAQQIDVNEQAISVLFSELQQRTTYAGKDKAFEQLVTAYAKITIKDVNAQLGNLWASAPDGKLYTLEDVYGRCMDFAFGKIMTGATDANSAIRQATRELANRGIRTLPNGKSGRSVSVEYATRRYVLNRMGALHMEISRMNHSAIGANGWELSAHRASAPDHEPYQGRQYTNAEYEALNNTLERKIGTWQCRHVAYPIIMGISAPAYTDAELQDMIDQNAAGVTYQGKHYTLAEAEQERNSIESALRRDKLRCLADAELGDKEQLLLDQIRLNRLREEYVRFCRATNQLTRSDRLQVAGFGRSEAAKSRWAVKKANPQDGVLHQLKYLGNVSKAQRASIENELSLLPNGIRAVAEMKISGIRMLDKTSNLMGGYNFKTHEILLQEMRTEGALIHEYAHALERVLDLYHDPVFLATRGKGLENIGFDDIIEDTDSFSEAITRVVSDKLISPYQGRLYDAYGIYDGTHFSLDGMREYFSEGLRAYYFEAEHLKQCDPDLFAYIKELMG